MCVSVLMCRKNNKNKVKVFILITEKISKTENNKIYISLILNINVLFISVIDIELIDETEI